MQDLHNKVKVSNAVNPLTQTNSSAAIVGNIIDTAGFDSLEFAILYGALTDADATFAVSMDHGDVSNLSDAAAVPADQLLGTLAAAGTTFAGDNTTKKVGYVGFKRYVRLTITPTANDAGAASIAALAIQGNARHTPAGETQVP